jgi:predicted molibdopterin-dependent oxidoreductase YjgC
MAGGEAGPDGDDAAAPLLVRATVRDGAQVRFTFDGRALTAHAGETILVAILTQGPHLRAFEFAPAHRAGFCLMGACQDCWVWFEDGGRARACTTPITEGLRIVSRPPMHAGTPR